MTSPRAKLFNPTLLCGTSAKKDHLMYTTIKEVKQSQKTRKTSNAKTAVHNPEFAHVRSKIDTGLHRRTTTNKGLSKTA